MEGNVRVEFHPPRDSPTAVDARGAPVEQHGDPIVAYAKVRDVSTGERLLQDTEARETATEFEVRYTRRRDGITGGWTARSRGGRYNLTGKRRVARPGTTRDEWLVFTGTRLQ